MREVTFLVASPFWFLIIMKKLLLLSFTLCSSLLAFAQTQLSDADLKNAWSTKSVSGRISCHDPSIFIDNITDPNSPKYYIYGSHLGRGYTTESSNYQNWSTFKAGEESTNATNSLFANTSGVLVNYSNAYTTHAITKVKNCNGKEVTFGNFNAHGWQYKGNNVQGNQWAPDVIYNKTMKKWCMYMSLNGDNWCSSICCFTSDSPEGPWIYQGPVVFSGFGKNFTHNSYSGTDDWKNTDYAIATGDTSLPERYSPSENYGNFWPNCIDPCVFYDDDNNLWMSYGSWSGGIFILRLNPENGLRDYSYKYAYEENGVAATPGAASRACTSDPYFGKKIGGGYYCSGEASYIQKIGNYYYLWITNGGLTAAGGYQMRVYRSENPDGPYTDPWGLSAMPGKYLLNYGPNAGRDYGVKLFGNYKWDTMAYGELAQGHNSATIDLRGHSLLVNHVRFNNNTEGHQVRVHQLFQTQDGWIVASPFEYNNSTAVTDEYIASHSFTTSDICGDYQLMIHKFRQDTDNKECATPVNISLNEDGTVTGAYTGTWSCPEGTSYIDIKLNKVLGSTYSATFHGVLAKQVVDNTNISTLIFSACGTQKSETTQCCNSQSLTTSGLCIWGSKADAKAAIKFTLDKMTIAPFNDGATITSKPTLPSTGLLGTNIYWESSDENVLKDDGTVVSKGDVVLTMILSKDGYEYRKAYNLTVNAEATPTVTTYYPVSQTKDLTAGWWENFSTSNYNITAGKNMKFKFYNYSDRANNWDNWCLYGANYPHGAGGYSEYFGVRCDNWDNTSASNTGCTSNFNWDTFKDDMDGSLVDMTVNYSSDYKFTMSATITTTSGTVYSYAYTKTISSKPATICLFFVNEKSYIDGSIINGIELPTVINSIDDGAIYNTAGQRVGADYKGIVIRNGRKYIQK